MNKIKFSVLLLLLLFQSCSSSGQVYDQLEDFKGIKSVTAESGITSPVTITVLYDNYVCVKGTKADWGYSVVIEGLDKGILFDTGTRQDVFESNFKEIGIDPSKIDILVISHEHGDHTGGIPSFVKMRTAIPVIIPHSFSSSFKKQMTGYELHPILADAPAEICDHLFTSGEFDYKIAEQTLVLDTKKGLVVLTGCSHPGIVEMLSKIKTDFNKNIYMVFGGFHLMNKSDSEMNEIISAMKDLGNVKCGATHCTGDKQIEMFKVAFGDDYFGLGTGNKIRIE
ncbi:MAG TPA: MBL fold metallo-hydrolase [Bacteroidales bacterium]|nr:MBL fold metallo-hydrolase [Bacteroidales bacterium]